MKEYISNFELPDGTTKYLKDSEARELIKNTLSDVVIVGDSYTALPNSNWAENLSKNLNLTLHKFAQSSMGYFHQVNGKTFIDLLKESTDLDSYANKVKYLIVYGGINDYDATRSQIETKCGELIIYAKQKLVNAQILIVGPQTSIQDVQSRRMIKIRQGLERACLRNGVCYINAQNWLINSSFPYTMTYASDRLHPSDLGYKIITSKMLGIFNNTPQINVDYNVNLTSGFSGKAETTSNEHFVHFSIKATGEIRKGQYTDLAKITGVDNLDLIENIEGFTSRQNYYPVYKIDENNNVTDFVGCARITTSSQDNNSYHLYFVSLLENFTGNVVCSGDIYFNYINQNSSYN